MKPMKERNLQAKIYLGTIELNLTPDGYIQIIHEGLSPSEVEEKLNENEDYEHGFVVKKVMEEFDRIATEIDERLENVIRNV